MLLFLLGQGFENYSKVSELHQKIYILICKRFLSIFFPSAEYTRLSLTIDIHDESFFANSKVCTNLGYLILYKDDKKAKDGKDNSNVSLEEDEGLSEEDISSSELIKKIKKGQKLQADEFTSKEGETSPPSRYSSGSIILAMENAGKLIEDEKLREQIKGSGIGTYATRAEIIKKLNRIGYISTNTKTQILTPTNKGELVYKVVRYTMSDMLNPELTASWEKGLEMVANKEIKSDEFMIKLEKYVKDKVQKVKSIRFS